jgi:dnd system-associated protein 4
VTEHTSVRDRIIIDETVHSIYKELTDGSSLEQAPFQTMKDVFMLAVALGFQKGSRRPAPSGSKVTIRKDVFKENDILLLKAIAIAETGDVDVLTRENEILAIAEGFAQSGIHDIKSYLLDQPGRPLWNLISLYSL